MNTPAIRTTQKVGIDYAWTFAKNCGLKDSSSSQNKIPNTGKQTITIAILVVALLTLGGAISIRKYKDIK